MANNSVEPSPTGFAARRGSPPTFDGARTVRAGMRLKRYLKFEAKFGWSEVIALSALLLASLAFLEGRRANQPSVSVQYFPIGVGPVRDTRSGRDSFATLMPLVFTNSGGRATTLLTFRPSQGVAPVLFVADGRARSEARPFEFFLLSRMIESAQEWEAFLPLMKSFDPVKRPPLVNMIIPAGESRVVYVGLVSDVYGRQISSLLIAIEAEFSHGARQPIRAAIEVRPPREGR